MSGECPEKFGFADLRPFFTVAHYGSGRLAPSLQRHLESCEACRKKWAFLERTDPQLAMRYRKDVRVLIQQAQEFERPIAEVAQEVPVSGTDGIRAQVSEMRPAITELLRSAPLKYSQVSHCWRSVREISEREERFQQSRHLAEVARFLLKRSEVQRETEPKRQEEQTLAEPAELRFMTKVMNAYDELDSGEQVRPEPVNSVEDFLFIASLPFTSFETDYPIVEFQAEDEHGELNISQFRQAQERFETFVRREEESVRW
ncbi:MAG TPA: hypothetical protein VMF91_02445 [Bryobacteraceae bacterium]|nr:hypothetical protein [Bryobacteraceae bacterium]